MDRKIVLLARSSYLRHIVTEKRVGPDHSTASRMEASGALNAAIPARRAGHEQRLALVRGQVQASRRQSGK
jgi:hypothetical protein